MTHPSQHTFATRCQRDDCVWVIPNSGNVTELTFFFAFTIPARISPALRSTTGRALELEETIAARAKGNVGGRGKVIQKSEKVSTTHDIAAIAGVSHDTATGRALAGKKNVVDDASTTLSKPRQLERIDNAA